MQARHGLAVIAVQLDVVIVHLIGRPETEHRAGADQLLVDQLGEHFTRILVQRGGGFTDHFVFEDARNLPARSQEMKNGVQSMYSASTLRSMLSSTRVPVKVGLTGV
jgi:hypothetical protein